MAKNIEKYTELMRINLRETKTQVLVKVRKVKKIRK